MVGPTRMLKIIVRSGDGSWQIALKLYNTPASIPARPVRITGTRWGALRPEDLPLPLDQRGKIVADKSKRAEVKEAFEWSWAAYERDAWGSDEVRSLPGRRLGEVVDRANRSTTPCRGQGRICQTWGAWGT